MELKLRGTATVISMIAPTQTPRKKTITLYASRVLQTGLDQLSRLLPGSVGPDDWPCE